MKLLKAIISGILLYAVMFLCASTMLLMPKYISGIAMVIISAIVTFAISKFFYFKNVKVENPIRNGLLFGLILIVIIFVIEIPVMVYGFVKEIGWNYFKSWDIVLVYLMVLLMPVVAIWKGKSRKRK
jgi:hypothetical protein